MTTQVRDPLAGLKDIISEGVFLDDTQGGLDYVRSALEHAGYGTNRLSGLGGGVGPTRAPHNPYGVHTETRPGMTEEERLALENEWQRLIEQAEREYAEKEAAGKVPSGSSPTVDPYATTAEPAGPSQDDMMAARLTQTRHGDAGHYKWMINDEWVPGYSFEEAWAKANDLPISDSMRYEIAERDRFNARQRSG